MMSPTLDPLVSLLRENKLNLVDVMVVSLPVEFEPRRGGFQEARNTLFCRSREKLHNVVLKGVRNISDTLQNPAMKFPLQRHI